MRCVRTPSSPLHVCPSLLEADEIPRSHSHPPDQPIALLLVKPVLAREVDDLSRSAAVDFCIIQVPSSPQPSVVVPHLHLLEVTCAEVSV